MMGGAMNPMADGGASVSDRLIENIARVNELLAGFRWSYELGPLCVWHFVEKTDGPVSVFRWGVRVGTYGVSLR